VPPRRKKKLKGLQIFIESWVHGHGAVGVGCMQVVEAAAKLVLE